MLVGKNSSTSAMSGSYQPHMEPPFLRELAKERENMKYPQTLAVLNLLASLIHIPTKSNDLIAGFATNSPSVPSDLGKGSRPSGAAPYMSFVIDHVFLNLDNQRYLNDDGKWQLAEACLKVLEHSLLAYDLRPLLDMSTVKGKGVVHYGSALVGLHEDTIASSHLSTSSLLCKLLHLYLEQPGFDVITRILSGNRLITDLIRIIEHEKQHKLNSSKKSVYFVRSLTRCLRIIARSLDLQNMVANLLLPQITRMSTRLPSGEIQLLGSTFPPLPRLSSLGQLMQYHAGALSQLAQFVGVGDYEEIGYLSINILRLLATDATDRGGLTNIKPVGVQSDFGGMGTMLTTMIATADDSSGFVFDFGQRLEIDEPESLTYDDYEYDINTIPFWQAERTMAMTAPQEDGFGQQLGLPSVRLAMLDMLVGNISETIPSPSLAEFFLGFQVLSPGPKGDLAASQIGLESIRRLVRQGMEDLDQSEANRSPSLILTHPILAERCYELIYRLCTRKSTSAATMENLRTKDDFVYLQIKSISPRLENDVRMRYDAFAGQLVTVAGTQVQSDFFSLMSLLYQRTWLFKTLALELHTQSTQKHNVDVIRLVELLFMRHNKPARDAAAAPLASSIFLKPSDGFFDQPLSAIVEWASSLDFEWHDTLEASLAEVPNLVYFGHVDLADYQITTRRGVTLNDIQEIYKRLREEQRQMERTHGSCSEAKMMAVDTEISYLLHKAMVENRQRCIYEARMHCLRAWRQVVLVTLIDCFDVVGKSLQDTILSDLTSLFLRLYHTTCHKDETVRNMLDEPIHALLGRMRQDKDRQVILRGCFGNIHPREKNRSDANV